jgi:hypothetical protein
MVYDQRWETSRFKNLKMMKPKQFGSVAEKIIKDVLEKLGFKTTKTKSTQYDLIVNGVKTEIKASCVNKGSDDSFSFLQFRPDQEATRYILGCFHFDKFELWVLSKNNLMKNIEANIIKKQHGGKTANSRMFCYNGNPKNLIGVKQIG